MLTEVGCRARQQRLLERMAAAELDIALVSDPRHVYYFSRVLETQNNPTAFILWADGTSVLVTPLAGEGAVAGTVLSYPTYSASVVLEYLPDDAAKRLAEALASHPGKAQRIGVEQQTLPARLAQELATRYPDATQVELLPTIYELCEIKDEDEIALLQADIALIEEAYRAAQATIRPGVTELDVYYAMYSAIVKRAGTSVPFAGDFSCGLRAVTQGGPPTRRVLLDGDLYILDIFPNWHGYMADMCRTFAVTTVSAKQLRAWELVNEALALAESLVKPGVEARWLHQQIARHLDGWELVKGTFFHHLGHGIGMHGHERPRIHGGSPHVFKVGQTVALEPGVYHEELQGGIRLEHNYVLRASGLERLSTYPLDLK